MSYCKPGTRLRGRRGYTLIELVLVIVLMGILTATAFVALGPSLDRGRVRAAARVIASDLQYAQLLAVRHRTPIQVLFVSSAKQVIIRERQTSTILRTRSLGSNTEFLLDQLSASPAMAEIFPTGIVRETVTVTVGLKGFQRKVMITFAGQIRIETV